jgi:hypothetical protein
MAVEATEVHLLELCIMNRIKQSFHKMTNSCGRHHQCICRRGVALSKSHTISGFAATAVNSYKIADEGFIVYIVRPTSYSQY